MSGTGGSSSQSSQAITTQPAHSGQGGQGGFTDAYNKAYTMSQLYGIERPDPIPLTEHQERGRQRAINEIVEV